MRSDVRAGEGALLPARFDDLVAGVGLRFDVPGGVLVAWHPDEVLPVLRDVERQTAQGQWAHGFVSYEAAAGLDPTLPVHGRDDDDPPLVWFALTQAPRRVPVIGPQEGDEAAAPVVEGWRPDWDFSGHRDDVLRVQEAIARGLTYQCNLTSRLRGTARGAPDRLYRDLALGQRARYAALVDTGRHAVVSASPELFFEWADGRLRTRPMKGTAVRGRTPAEDRHLLEMLLASPKERAENVIVTDLLRNDVSRVVVPGTVEVTELCAPERYETVWQLVSEVAGVLRPDVGLAEVFAALFPCGSVTGAPKPHTMALIRELEPASRGVYCGAVGWVAPPWVARRARFSVAIRTVVIDRVRRSAVYGTGGGITWGSDPDAEVAELHAKTRVLHHRHEEFELLETMGYLPGRGVRHLDRHLRRLAGSAEHFGFGIDPERVRREVEAAAQGPSPARIRLLLERGGGVRVESAPMPAPSPGPVVLAVDDIPVDTAERWLYHKTTRRQTYRSRAARHPDADDVLLVNEHGQVTESTIANVAVRLDAGWCTPPVEAGCLPGVLRGLLVESGRLRERLLTLDDLGRAEGIALVSSLRGWRPAVLAASAPAVSESGGSVRARTAPSSCAGAVAGAP